MWHGQWHKLRVHLPRTTLMAESEELRSVVMKVGEETEKTDLKLIIQESVNKMKRQPQNRRK